MTARQIIWVYALALSCLVSSNAWAQPEQPATETSTPRTASDEVVPRRAPPVPPVIPEVEDVESRRPSGFWTSTRPAKNGAYRYRLLAIGVAIAAITLGFMIWLVRRKMREPDQGFPAEPDLAEPDLAEPDLAEPDLAEPNPAEPE